MAARWWVAGLLWLGLGCSGQIGESGEGAAAGPLQPGAEDPARGDGDEPGGAGASADPARPALDPQAADPGRVTLHRLNRVEYNDTVRDLLGTTLRPADDFPADDRGYGYDNIADVLSVSPLQVELYWNAARALVDDAMAVVRSGATRYEAEEMEASTGSEYEGAWNLYSSGSVQQTLTLQAAGQYRIAVRAWAQQAGDEPARMTIDLDAQPVDTFDVTADASTPAVYEATVELGAGAHILGASFLNDYYDPDAGADRNLLVDWLEVEGPLGARANNPLRARIMTCEPDAGDPLPCLREVAGGFARRAFRRSLEAVEIEALVKVAQDALEAGDELESATRLMLRAVLVSPHFLYRVELDPAPDSLTPHRLSQHELASRLSYFLWSSMPDEALLAAADAGALDDDAALRGQVQRMLADDRAQALVENFAGQWLFIRALADHEPDYQAYPAFDEELRGSMRGETERYFGEFLFGEATMDELLTARFSFVNDRLARHYGVPAPGAGFSRVALDDGQRAGLLTQAGLLTVTSYPTRTSPVKRGKWVLEQLLCEPPPPPPPGVEGLEQPEMPSGSLRERMEQHRQNPTCASCHSLMDPIGFGFEHFDGIGAYRDSDQGFAIDASGELPGGAGFDGALQLAGLLADDPRFARCTAQQLLTYALGRGVGRDDDVHVDALTEAFVESGYRLPALIEAVVLSDAFRARRGEEAP